MDNSRTKRWVVCAVLLVLPAAFALQTSTVGLHLDDIKQEHGGLNLDDVASDLGVPEAKAPKVFHVPTATRCVIVIVLQYMVVYTCLAACRTYHEFRSSPKGNVERALTSSYQALQFGPMICVLFIACRMRVEFLSHGRGQPQLWVQYCMMAMTAAVCINSILVLVLPVIVGEPLPLHERSCDLEQPKCSARDDHSVYYLICGCRYMILLGLYGGLAGVVFGISTYLPPGATSLADLPKPAPAVICPMILSVVFFGIHSVIFLCRALREFRGVELTKAVQVMQGAAVTVQFAPMLSIVFLAARMRALQHGGQPQLWAQYCMFASTGALCLAALLKMVEPLLLPNGTVTRREDIEGSSVTFAYAVIAARLLCTFGFCGGVMGVIASIYLFEAPAGPDFTLPVSPTVQCVVNLTCQFFFIYLVLIVCDTISEVSFGIIPLETSKFYAAIDASKVTVEFAPMLAILFVTTRMYALLITDQRGSPPPWVQDGMCMATWALFISFLACLVTGFVMDEVETDHDGNVTNKFEEKSKALAVAMTALRYFTMFLLYGGIITVVTGLLIMTPETASGTGPGLIHIHAAA